MWERSGKSDLASDDVLHLGNLREAHLHFLEGMRNDEAAAQYPDEYRTWREKPALYKCVVLFPLSSFFPFPVGAVSDFLLGPELGRSLVVVPLSINGSYPIVEQWAKARAAWGDILSLSGDVSDFFTSVC